MFSAGDKVTYKRTYTFDFKSNLVENFWRHWISFVRSNFYFKDIQIQPAAVSK